jgi:hypothetical protein
MAVILLRTHIHSAAGHDGHDINALHYQLKLAVGALGCPAVDGLVKPVLQYFVRNGRHHCLTLCRMMRCGCKAIDWGSKAVVCGGFAMQSGCIEVSTKAYFPRLDYNMLTATT